MTHDPLCRRKGFTEALMGGCAECNLIAKVREDEQENARKAVEAQAKRMIEIADIQAGVAAAMASDEMLEKCIAAVEDLFGAKDESLHWLLDGDAVLASLRALEEKP